MFRIFKVVAVVFVVATTECLIKRFTFNGRLQISTSRIVNIKFPLNMIYEDLDGYQFD